MAGLLLLACFREPSRLSDKQVNPRQTKRAGANCRVSRSKIQRVSDPYFDPLAGLQPFTLYYDFRQKRPKAYYKFTAIYTIFIHSYNSNPSCSATKRLQIISICRRSFLLHTVLPVLLFKKCKRAICMTLYLTLYRFEMLSMKASIRSADCCFIFSVICPYTSRVKAAVWCPRFPCTVFTSSPACSAATA